jgi:predicted O-linked N-acetylglucosamine transferase (SPINDLY family)
MSISDTLVRAIQLQGSGHTNEAAAQFRAVLAADPANGPAHYSLGLIAWQAGDPATALQRCATGVAAAPGFAPLHHLHGTVLQGLGRNDEALAAYDRALALQPDFIDVLLNSGALLRAMYRHHDALERFNQILRFAPDHPSALGNCGILLTEFKQSAQAIAMFERLVQVKPDADYALGLLFFERLHVCDWTDFDALRARIVAGVRAGQRVCKSLAFMSASSDAQDHQRAARIFAAHQNPRQPQPLWNGERYHHQRIRIAYVSPDLREHPVSHLMCGIFERHDKSRFETIAISLGVDDGSRLRGRILAAFDEFVDARDWTAERTARWMREREIDIAIDLGGYTSDTRTAIFAWRPAPVQVNYLGYPGTMGVDYYDYILADRHIIPDAHKPFYDEQVVYLPDAYLPVDDSVQIAERTPTRAECGLPEEGVVFCSFSHDYKITPPVFDVWMRLLAQVPGSVLWLVSRGEATQRNLRKEAALRGIAPERLVFAGRVPRVEDHLARYRQADIFLDTHPYNAHTTAADALMAGLPVVTCVGDSFPSRVAGSLVKAAGLPKLATDSLAAYEALALKLAHDPERRASLRARLLQRETGQALSDTDGFRRHLEAAYTAMWRRTQLGGASDALACNPSEAPT